MGGPWGHVYNEEAVHEHVWRMVKDEPKWRGGSSINLSGKRAKTSASGTYTSSTDTHASINTNDVEVEVRPIGTKTAKRKGKEKSHAPYRVHAIQEELKNLSTILHSKLEAIREELKDLNENLKISNQAKQEKRKRDDLLVLTQNTIHMTSQQLSIHNMLCADIKAKYGIN